MALSFAVYPAPASAFAHLWKITEIYSNEDGSVQFVELSTDSEGETDMTEVYLISQPHENRFDFSSDLEVETTVDKYLLVATEAFAELPHGVEPDFLMPANFIVMEAGVIEFWSKRQGRYRSARKRDELVFEELPGGVMSLNRTLGDVTIYTEEASPTNYDGQVGTLPEPDSRSLAIASLATLLVLYRRSRVTTRNEGGVWLR